MSRDPRRALRPLDHAEALQRAAQITAAADAERLRILSVIAAEPAGGIDPHQIARRLDGEDLTVDLQLDRLEAANLIERIEGGAAILTADAWMRFGRLLIGGTPDATLGPAGMGLPPAVERIARQLQYRYASVFSPETVRRYVAESYALLAERAKIRTYLPALATKYATDRLSALATASGLSPKGTPEVLFVCVHNSGRSQLASSIMHHVADGRIHVRSAGTAPSPAIDPMIIELLDEVGIPFADEFPKPLTDEVVRASDVVVTMGCGDACPVYPGRRYLNWELEDPLRLERSGARRVRDELVDRVTRLVGEMA